MLGYLKRRRVRNVVWLTADVHYCAAHYYDPARAAFRDFDGFWEFVSGPLNAGSLAPTRWTARSDRRWSSVKAPPPGPSEPVTLQRAAVLRRGEHRRAQRRLTVDLRDINGLSVFSRTLRPRER